MGQTTLPLVQDNQLILPEERSHCPQPIQVGSDAWYAWLRDEHTRSFTFRCQRGSFTARREQQRNDWYWYAYRRHRGKLHKTYLGKASELTLKRLYDAAASLADRVAPGSSQLMVAENGRMQRNWLLATKLARPVTASLIPRPHLLVRLNMGMQGVLTLVTAPAGSGKTALLSAWVGTWPHPVAWLTLDADDNDPARFWTYIIAALRAQQPEVGSDALTLLQSYHPPALETILTVLLNDLTAVSSDVVLILDDYHTITSSVIHKSLDFFLAHLPPSLHLVIATRITPALPLARLRAHGQLTEVQAGDLHFTLEETQAFLTRRMGLALSDDAVTTLAARTEGWIAGLHLAALSLQQHPDPERFIATFAGRHHAILDYLMEEVLHQQPADVQHFLLQTSILNRLTGALCDVVTRQSDGTAMLRQLADANLFLFPLDDERVWYRYHTLFVDVLRERLNQLHLEQVAKLHCRASHWYADCGMLTEAIPHALAAADYDYAAQCIEQVVEPMLLAGETITLLNWFGTLPNEIIRSRPRLCVLHAQLLIITMQMDLAVERLNVAEAFLPVEGSPHLAGEIAAVRTVIAAVQGEQHLTITHAREALDLLPADSLFLRGITALALGFAYLRGEDIQATFRTLDEAARSSLAAGNMLVALTAAHALGMLHIMQGLLRQAQLVYQRAWHMFRQAGKSTPLLNILLMGEAELQREWNNLDRAEALARESIRAGQMWWGSAEFLVDASMTLARVQRARGDLDAASQTITEADKLGRERGVVPMTLLQVAILRAQVWLAQSRTHEAVKWAESLYQPGEAEVPKVALQSWPIVREQLLFALARIRMAEERFGDALQLVEYAFHTGAASENKAVQIEAYMLQALVFHRQDESETAKAALRNALKLAQPEGFVRLFVDEGPPMQWMLQALQGEKGELRSYIQTLLAAFPQAYGDTSEQPANGHSRSDVVPLVEPLSPRELEVLQLIASGLSNQQIAERLVIAVSTVRTHAKNIYAKLEVSSRTQAVARARMLGILN